MSSENYDLVVIGGGPGGYVAAIRAAQLGLKTACIEKEKKLGGTCLRVGCIPSKALLESSALYSHLQHDLKDHGIQAKDASIDVRKMQKRKDKVVMMLSKGIEGLFKKNKITRYTGVGRFDGKEDNGQLRIVVDDEKNPTVLNAGKVIIATGSNEAQLRGVDFDGDRIGSSTQALSYAEVPERLVVIGAGAIGLELGSVWSRLGAKVTVLEYFDRILPGMDHDLAQGGQKILEEQGLEFRLGTRVTGVRNNGDTCVVEIDGQDPLECDKVLVAVGRVPNTTGLNLESVGISTDERGRIPTQNHFQTVCEGVYAIGDVIAGPMLAHKAEEEGVACAEAIVQGHGHVDYNAIACIVYTDPEIAGVGKTEDELKQDGVPYRSGTFPFMANGRARAVGETRGFVKVLAHKDTDRVLGVHILGKHAGDLIAEAAMAISFGASSEDIARVCHAHPTLSEVVKEAALAVDGRAIHM